MDTYHKIQSVFKRDPATKHKTFIEGDYTTDAFRYLRNNIWLFREKVDGTNIRVHYGPMPTIRHPDRPELPGEALTVDSEVKVVFGGRTSRASIPTPLANALNGMFTVEKFEAAGISPGTTLYGEGYGAGIQKGGGDYRPDQSFILFDVKVGNWWLREEDSEDMARKLGISAVPAIGVGTLAFMVELCRKGFPSRFAGVDKPEGIVAVPEISMFDRSGERIITKCKLKDFQ